MGMWHRHVNKVLSYLIYSATKVSDLVLIQLFSFLTREKHVSKSNSKTSAAVKTEIPIQRPNDPPISDIKFGNCV